LRKSAGGGVLLVFDEEIMHWMHATVNSYMHHKHIFLATSESLS
jgi:hypothetical protein